MTDITASTFFLSICSLSLIILCQPVNVSGDSSLASTTPALVPTTPKQDATPNLWKVTNNATGGVCIVMRVGVRMLFNYNSSGTLKTKERTDVPTDAVASGYCGSTMQQLVLSFYDEWTLTFTFFNNETTQEYRLSGVSLSYTLQPGRYPFLDAAFFAQNESSSKDHFLVDDGKSYICTSRQMVLTGSSQGGPGLISLDLLDMQVEAFRGNKTTEEFSQKGGRCSDDEVSNLIPIIVGAALGGLILIVIIAYFIGLSRSKRAYTSI